MFSLCRARYMVKVVSASLIESLPDTRAGKNASVRCATLTFHLHRSNASEPYGVACVFGVPGTLTSMCFLRSIAPTLATSSSVLSAVLPNGKPANGGAVRVLSVDGEVNPTEERLRALMKEGRDAVLHCAVLATAEGDAGAAADEQEAEDGDGVGGEVGAAATRTPKRRGRKPKSVGATRAAALDGDGADEAGAQPDEGAREVARSKGRGRPRFPTRSRRVLKRARNKGRRAASAPRDEDGAADGEEGVASANAAHATEEVMEVESMSGTPPPSKPRRRRRTKTEMAAARLQMVTEEASKEVKHEGGEEEHDGGTAWFRQRQQAEDEEMEGLPAAEEGDDAAAATPVKGKRGRKQMAAAMTTAHRLPSPTETATEVEESEDAEVQLAAVEHIEKAGVEGADEEEMAF